MSNKRKKCIGLFERIVDKDNIYKSYRKSLKGKNKYSNEAMIFSSDETYSLNKLRQSLIGETYQFDDYITFKVYEPKERVVDAPHFKDKIVQLALNNALKGVYYPSFIYDNYACIDNKGTHKCVERIQYFLKKAKWEYGDDAYIIKIDIKKFFYTIDREILKDILKKRIYCEKTLKLLYKIIDSAKLLGDLGLPLGNTLSQLCANIYMNEFDQYCKRKLSLHYYIRYVDDAIVIAKDKNEAKRILELMTVFLKEKLNLDINTDKTKIFPINQGVNSIGFKLYATHRLLRDDCKKKIKRKIKAMPRLIEEKRLTLSKAEQMLNSWLGHAKHGCSYNFIKSLLKKHNYLYMIGKNKLKLTITTKRSVSLCNQLE